MPETIPTTSGRGASRWPQVGAMCAAVVVGVLSFFYRFNALGGALGGFGNDQFIHMSRARQLLGGDLPLRDYVDPGAPLTVGMSALVQRLAGYNLLGEALLTVVALAIGAALTVWLAARLTGRVWPALMVGLLQVAMAPRLYNYPKILFTSFGIWLCWRYVDRPQIGRLIALAAFIALSFLFRHDFLIYATVLVVATLAMAHRDRFVLGFRRAIIAGGWALLFVSPFLVYLQWAGGVPAYVRDAAEFARADAARTSFEAPSFDRTLSAPLVSMAPVPAPPPPRVNVRWAEEIDESVRQAREARYRLTAPELREGTTWTYLVDDASSANIEALVRDPFVKDTHGIDRTAFTLRVPVPETGWRASIGRVRLAPELTSEQNAVAWLYYVLVALPFAAAATWVARARQPHDGSVETRQHTAYVWPVIVLTALLGLGFLTRGTINARLADVAVPAGILTAWLLARPGRGRQRPLTLPRRAAHVIGCVVLVVSTWSIAVAGEVRSIADRSKILEPASILDRADVVARTLALSPPLLSLAGDADTPFAAAARYIDRCTSRDDRVFVFANLPELPFFSGRLFAGGHAWVLPGYGTSPEQQQRTIERLRAHRVPLVITEAADVYDDEYRPDFPLIAAYLDGAYRELGSMAFGESLRMRVLLARDAAWSSTDPATGLACGR